MATKRKTKTSNIARPRVKYVHHTSKPHTRPRRLRAGTGGNTFLNMAIDTTMGFIAGRIAGNLAGQFLPIAGIGAPIAIAFIAQKQFKKPYAAAGAMAAAVAGGVKMLNFPILNDAMNDPLYPLSASNQFVNPGMITGSQPAQIMLPDGTLVNTMNDAPLSATQYYTNPQTGDVYAMNDEMNDDGINDDGMNDDGMNDYNY